MKRDKLICALFVLFLCAGCSDDSNWSLQQTIKRIAADYPDQQSQDFKQFSQQCSACHRPPMPDIHTAQLWLSTVNRMQQHRQQRGLLTMTDREKQQVLAYLQSHAQQDVQR